MINHFRAAIPGIDADIERTIETQCLDENSYDYGTVSSIFKGYTEPDVGIKTASKLVSAYYNKLSKWYRSDLVMERAIIAARHTIKRMNIDGTMDLMETNFHDPTMNGFSMHSAGPVFKLLRRETQHTPLENEAEACFEEFVRRSGDAIVNGGFHTPNHRWVVSSALAYCYNTLGDEKYLNHIKKFLENEGIDCDENGEFTERSAATYTVLCQRVLIMMAEELNMPELLDHVARSLRMSMTFMEPDKTLNTLNSTRQDFGKDPNFNGYYEAFMKMAILTGDEEFAWMSEYIRSNGGTCDMTWFLLFPEHEAKQEGIGTKKPCFDYEKLYVESGVLRQRIGDATLTLIKSRPLFAKLHFKNKPVLIRFCGSFFAQGQFAPQTLEKTEDGYRMTYRRSCGYVGPYSEKQKSNLWKDMDYSKRPKLGVQNYDVTFNFKLIDGELKVDFEACTADGTCDNIPCKLELMFPAGGVFENDSTMVVTRNGDYVFQKDEAPCSITYNDHLSFVIEGGFCEHYYAKGMRGAIGADGSAFTVCFTGFTPQKRSFSIKYYNSTNH